MFLQRGGASHAVAVPVKQEHRQVAGSCKNKRFLLSEHGSQTLDRKRQTEMGGREREDDYHSVLLPAIRKVRVPLWTLTVTQPQQEDFQRPVITERSAADVKNET
ncbi:hypothetical protein EYF80_028189 [Liparis tanakae]|uniref:Uncharacterized protein n=1 Tax=Liparis tanakae TaxID=230148 RepID=A0A4Z2H6N6_9TELE|nr:hypothetical protein EYF80_028189 [Liparis tanakae]